MNEVLKGLLANPAGLALCWLGNGSWLLHGDGKLIGFDLDLVEARRLQKSPLSSLEIAPHLDALFITHEHGDHFNTPTCRILLEESSCVFVTPQSCRAKAQAIGIPADRIVIPKPREPLEIIGIPVEPQRALHGNQEFTVAQYANLEDCGYIISLSGKRIYQPGDTVLSEEFLDFKDIDVLFVSPTIHNMYTDRSAILIRALQPHYIFPQHFNTYEVTDDNSFWTVGYPDELWDALDESLQACFHKLDQGEIYLIP